MRCSSILVAAWLQLANFFMLQSRRSKDRSMNFEGANEKGRPSREGAPA
jgi:hypothetical protein